MAEEPPAPTEELETIVITGSNIPNSDIETALPIQVIDKEQIERSGARTAEQVLRQVPANLIGASAALWAGGGAPAGLSSANLRGLGSGSTLVLINGHRSANYALEGGTVDLNSIPLAAVERIEVLKDGSSAIYGADAMAGVINFILRPDYAGAEVTAHATVTEHGGGEQREIAASLGHGDPARDGYNMFVTVDWQDNQELRAADRPFSRTALIPKYGINNLSYVPFPANVNTPDRDLVNPSYATGCNPPLSIPYPGYTFCGYDYPQLLLSLPPVSQLSGVAGLTRQMGANGQLYAELLYAHTQSTVVITPSPLYDAIYPAGGPYYPTAFANQNGLSGDLDTNYRPVQLGGRTDEVKTEAWNAIAGLKGRARDWDYDAAVIYSRNDETDALDRGWISVSKFDAAMATGLINPFGPSSPAGNALLASTQTTAQESGWGTTASVELTASRSLRELARGRVALAMGMELRQERLSHRYSSEFNTGDISGIGGPILNTTSTRDVAALYGELNLPITANAGAQLAARYDHYSDFGGTVNPKVALHWQLARGVLLRASGATGFRPPTAYDLRVPVTAQKGDINADPLRCPYTHLDSDCKGSVLLRSGGNPSLNPETSRGLNAGIVWSRYTVLSLSADYWQLHKSNQVGTLDTDTILYFYDAYGHYVERGPVDPAYPNLPGPITAINLLNVNLGELHTSGIDVGVELRSPPSNIGRFGLQLNGTYLTQWESQLDGLHFTSALGRSPNAQIGTVPRWRHYATLGWDFHHWRATLSQNFAQGYIDNNLTPAGIERRVPSYSLWNMQLSYDPVQKVKIEAGVQDLLDTNPPFSNQDHYFASGYEPAYAEPLGRTFYATLTYSFM